MISSCLLQPRISGFGNEPVGVPSAPVSTLRGQGFPQGVKEGAGVFADPWESHGPSRGGGVFIGPQM